MLSIHCYDPCIFDLRHLLTALPAVSRGRVLQARRLVRAEERPGAVVLDVLHEAGDRAADMHGMRAPGEKRRARPRRSQSRTDRRTGSRTDRERRRPDSNQDRATHSSSSGQSSRTPAGDGASDRLSSRTGSKETSSTKQSSSGAKSCASSSNRKKVAKRGILSRPHVSLELIARAWRTPEPTESHVFGRTEKSRFRS